MDLTKLKRGDLLYFDTGIETKIDDTVVCLMDNDIFRISARESWPDIKSCFIPDDSPNVKITLYNAFMLV